MRKELRTHKLLLICGPCSTLNSPGCWQGPMNFEFCCDLRVSPRGRHHCWFGDWTFEYCCQGKDVLAIRATPGVEITTFNEVSRNNHGQLAMGAVGSIGNVAELYLGTLQDTLTGVALKTPSVTVHGRHFDFRDSDRFDGRVWCDYCYSMAGTARLSTLRKLLEKTFADNVGGDYLEAGVWRGGTGIFARAIQRISGQELNRRVIMCDSFQGVPRPTTAEDSHSWNSFDYLQVPIHEVKDNFQRFHMLDSNILFVAGFFMFSLPEVRKRLIAEGRLLSFLYGDGDMFESFYDILYNLYDLISIGGYFWCDDCATNGSFQDALRAINTFRTDHDIVEPLEIVKGSSIGMYWQKMRHMNVRMSKYISWNATRVTVYYKQ